MSYGEESTHPQSEWREWLKLLIFRVLLAFIRVHSRFLGKLDCAAVSSRKAYPPSHRLRRCGTFCLGVRKPGNEKTAFPAEETRSFHLIDFPLMREIAETGERAHCSKILGQERVTPWRNLTEMSATRKMAKEALSAQLPERVLSSSHCTSRVPWLRISQPPQ